MDILFLIDLKINARVRSKLKTCMDLKVNLSLNTNSKLKSLNIT